MCLAGEMTREARGCDTWWSRRRCQQRANRTNPTSSERKSSSIGHPGRTGITRLSLAPVKVRAEIRSDQTTACPKWQTRGCTGISQPRRPRQAGRSTKECWIDMIFAIYSVPSVNLQLTLVCTSRIHGLFYLGKKNNVSHFMSSVQDRGFNPRRRIQIASNRFRRDLAQVSAELESTRQI